MLVHGSLRVRPWPPLHATTQQPCMRHAAQFRPRMVMPTAPYQGHRNTSILGAGAGPSPVRVSLQMSKGASINTQVLETAWPQGGHACPAPPNPHLRHPVIHIQALLSSTGETCSRFWGTNWPSKPRWDPMPCTRQDRLQSWAGSLGGSCGDDPKGAEATPLLTGPFQGLCTIPFDTALPRPCTGFIVLHRLQPLKPG